MAATKIKFSSKKRKKEEASFLSEENRQLREDLKSLKVDVRELQLPTATSIVNHWNRQFTDDDFYKMFQHETEVILKSLRNQKVNTRFYSNYYFCIIVNYQFNDF